MRKSLGERGNDFAIYLRDWFNTFRGKLTAFCLLGLFALAFTQNSYIFYIFDTFLIFTIFAASWDFLAGYVGQISFGHAIFLGIAGYVTAFTTRYGFPWITVNIFVIPWDWHVNFIILPWWAALILGALVSVLFGMIIGVPALRLKGPYLALGTLAMSLILYQIFLMGNLGILWEKAFPGTNLFGTDGIGQVRPISQIPGLQYFIILLIMCTTLIILIHLVKSKTGTIFKAIRDDETGAKSSGINTTKYKIYAFMISGFFAGIAGGLFALVNSGVNPGVFQPLYSFYAIIMAAIGGIASISGAALGSFLFFISPELLKLLGGIVEPIFIFSIVLILMIRFAEHGILKPLLEAIQQGWDIVLGR